MPNVGPLELAIVLIIALVIFGPKKLPELGSSMGKGLREFKNSVTGGSDDDEDEDEGPRTVVAEASEINDQPTTTRQEGTRA
jgi:sec-independent protein translocase protein TatA